MSAVTNSCYNSVVKCSPVGIEPTYAWLQAHIQFGSRKRFKRRPSRFEISKAFLFNDPLLYDCWGRHFLLSPYPIQKPVYSKVSMGAPYNIKAQLSIPKMFSFEKEIRYEVHVAFRPDPSQLERIIRVVKDCLAGHQAAGSLKAGVFEQEIQMLRLS